MRIRALDNVDQSGGSEHLVSPVFDLFGSQLENALERGVAHDQAYYVTRPWFGNRTYEEYFADRLLQGAESTIPKVFVLRGAVGSGKTCFARHILEKELANRPVLPVYIDTYRRVIVNQKTPRPLVTRFLKAVEKAIIDGGHFANIREYLAAVTAHLGFAMSDQELLAARHSFEAKDVIEFLLSSRKVCQVVAVIDNVDEASRPAVDNAIAFAHQLADEVECETGRCVVILPLREYVLNRFPDTERYAVEDLPPADEKAVLQAALTRARDQVGPILDETKEQHSLTVAYHLRRGREVDVKAKTVKISRSGVFIILRTLCAEIFDREREAAGLLIDLAAGNLKILVSSTFNLLRSSKLPLTPLFQLAFTPENALDHRDRAHLLPFGLTLECLMAVNRPGFDVEHSHVANVFRALSSTASNDFQNTLVTCRLLALINNRRAISLDEVRRRFHAIGYGSSYVDAAIVKALRYGLVKASHGVELSDLDSESTFALSAAGLLYIRRLIMEPAYLGFACEDVECPEGYVVRIDAKYESAASHGSREERFRAIRLFLEFVKEEEELERRTLRDKGVEEHQFRREFGLDHLDQRYLLYERMVAVVPERLERIERADAEGGSRA